jgi:hypothetical protein
LVFREGGNDLSFYGDDGDDDDEDDQDDETKDGGGRLDFFWILLLDIPFRQLL